MEIRPARRQLLVVGPSAALQAKAFELLMALIEQRDRTASRAGLCALADDARSAPAPAADHVVAPAAAMPPTADEHHLQAIAGSPPR